MDTSFMDSDFKSAIKLNVSPDLVDSSDEDSDPSVMFSADKKKAFWYFPVYFPSFNYSLADSHKKESTFAQRLSLAGLWIGRPMILIVSGRGFQLAKTFQLIYMLNFLNFKFTSKFNAFLKSLHFDPLSLVPNILDADEAKLECDPKRKFRISGMSCYFGNNSGNFYTFYLTLIAIKVFIFFPSKLLRPGKAKRLFLGMNRYFGFLKLVHILMALQLDVCLSCFVDIFNTIKDQNLQIYGKMMSIGTLALVALILVTFLKKAIAIKTNQEAEKEWLYIKHDMRQSVAVYGYFLKEIISVRDLIIPLAIVVFYSSTKMLVILFAVLMIPGLLVLIIAFPYRDPIQNIGSIISEGIYFLIILELIVHSFFPDTLGVESLSNLLYYEIAIVLIFTIAWTTTSALAWIGLVLIQSLAGSNKVGA